MFSYRHAFHAGNHADVLKHLILIECINHLLKKDVGITFIDTHAGAGIYQIDQGYATVSKESEAGIKRLRQFADTHPIKSDAILDYLKTIQKFNEDSELSIYPGSPALIGKKLRPQDNLKLFELHPSDIPLLESNVRALHIGRQTQIAAKDGFSGIKAFLPSPTRRACILIDPSYEDKRDYLHVIDCIKDGLKRLASGVFLIWYPYLSRIDSQELPNKLKELEIHGKPISWVHAELAVDSLAEDGLTASGMFVINPPWKLNETLQEALPELVEALENSPGSGGFKLNHFTP
jgi:23S rRNA (adenine2030-N6)-methyltransferase